MTPPLLMRIPPHRVVNEPPEHHDLLAMPHALRFRLQPRMLRGTEPHRDGIGIESVHHQSLIYGYAMVVALVNRELIPTQCVLR